MAINEACQVWIEQRIKEELEDGGEKSLREIGRVIAAEIEKVFEAKVNPGTVFQKARRIHADTNVSGRENQGAPTVERGHTGHKISPTEIVEEVEKRVRKGKSIREMITNIPGVNWGDPIMDPMSGGFPMITFSVPVAQEVAA